MNLKDDYDGLPGWSAIDHIGRYKESMKNEQSKKEGNTMKWNIPMVPVDEAPSSWEEWNEKGLWPEWIPEEWRRNIEKFWNNHDKGPKSWLQNAIDMNARPHGMYTQCRDAFTVNREWVHGRFVHTWNNMCVLIGGDGIARVGSVGRWTGSIDEKLYYWKTKLDGRQYGNEISQDEVYDLEHDGVLIFFGQSDDLFEIRGIIDDEVGAWEGTTIRITPDWKIFDIDENRETFQYNRKEIDSMVLIDAVWCPNGNDDKNGDGPAWEINCLTPGVKFEKFNIYEGEDLYCIGLIIAGLKGENMKYPDDIIPKTSVKWKHYINFYGKRAWKACGKKGYSFYINQNDKFGMLNDKVRHIEYQVHYRGNPMISGYGKSVAYYMIELPKLYPRRRRV